MFNNLRVGTLTEKDREPSETRKTTILRLGILIERDRELLETRKKTIDWVDDGTFIFAEHMSKKNYNNNMLHDIGHHNIFIINYVDQIPQDVPDETVVFLKRMPQSQHLILI